MIHMPQKLKSLSIRVNEEIFFKFRKIKGILEKETNAEAFSSIVEKMEEILTSNNELEKTE